PKPAPTTTTCLVVAIPIGRSGVGLEPLVHERGALVPTVAHALLDRLFEEAADTENLRLDHELDHATAMILAERLGAHRALVPEFVGQGAGRHLPAEDLLGLVETPILTVPETRAEQLGEGCRQIHLGLARRLAHDLRLGLVLLDDPK